MKKILVVDDEPSIELLMRQVFRKKIKTDEYQFSFADDGKVALDLIGDQQFDLILSDINMPSMDGISLLLRIKEINPEQRVIIFSAYSNTERIEKALKIGATNFLTKPIRANEIREHVAKALVDVEE